MEAALSEQNMNNKLEEIVTKELLGPWADIEVSLCLKIVF